MAIPDTQKAYIITKKGLTLKEGIPVIKDFQKGYALLKVKGVSLCGTDIQILKKDSWTQENIYPKMIEGKDFVLGHEFFGEIVKTSPGSTLKIGTIGACESHYPSPSCMEKDIDGHDCPDYGIFGIWGAKDASGNYLPCLGGAFSQYVLIPEANFYPVGNLSKKFHCSLIEPCGNTWKIAEALVKKGLTENVLIYGSGPHGLNLQIFLRYFGVKNIVAIEPDDFRRGFARATGAANFVLKPDELTDVFVRRITEDGFDVVIDVVGIKPILDDILSKDLVKEGGTIGLFGLPKEPHRVIETVDGDIPMSDFIFKSMKKKGKTDSGRSFSYVGFTGRTDHALKTLISALKGDDGDVMAGMLQRQLRIVGPLDMLDDLVKKGFPKNMSHDDMKLGFTPFET